MTANAICWTNDERTYGMGKHVFCRDLCIDKGEPLAGTGQFSGRTLLLRWPRGHWRAPRHESVGMSERLAGLVQRAPRAGVHVALVDRQGETGEIPLLQAMPEALEADPASEEELIGAIEAYLSGGPFIGTAQKRTTILVCTDSRRDACCAKYGFATFRALKEIADPDRFQLLQSTHVGGCRFAASIVVLPLRQRYGRLGPEQAEGFLDAIGRGEIYLPAYRGRTDVPEHEQVAEIAAMNWADAGNLPRTAIRLDAVSPPARPEAGDGLTISVRIAHERLDIHLRAEALSVQGSCEIVASGSSSSQIRWTVDTIERQSAR